MRAEALLRAIRGIGVDAAAGVPDSALKPFCSALADPSCGLSHLVAANEGAAVGYAVGHFLGTGRPACVYMQNSGLGNCVNPLTSLAHPDVYGIPMLLVVGWRGEPGVRDEPQHVFMGAVTTGLLDMLGIRYAVVGGGTAEEEVDRALGLARAEFSRGRQFALVIRRGALEAAAAGKPRNGFPLVREEVIGDILRGLAAGDAVVSTTGKISREVYERGGRAPGGRGRAFLTVGGMGHAVMIALGLAESRPGRRVWCLDGDGAVLMHMGGLAVAGERRPGNLIHVCLNNRAHESVGGMPTGAPGCGLARVAGCAGYASCFSARTRDEWEAVLPALPSARGPVFAEVMVSLDSRADLGRPRESPAENRDAFMSFMKGGGE